MSLAVELAASILLLTLDESWFVVPLLVQICTRNLVCDHVQSEVLVDCTLSLLLLAEDELLTIKE